MKRILLVILACLMSMNIQAQREHIKFMGIPLGCKISVFQKQLKKKGVFLDPQIKMLPYNYFPGNRFYLGCFANTFPDNIVVKFDRKTKIVGYVKVHYICKSEIELNSKFKSFEKDYKSKYDSLHVMDYVDEGKNGISIPVVSSTNDYLVGIIFLYKSIDKENNKYFLEIEYYDNDKEFSSSIDDDL